MAEDIEIKIVSDNSKWGEAGRVNEDQSRWVSAGMLGAVDNIQDVARWLGVFVSYGTNLASDQPVVDFTTRFDYTLNQEGPHTLYRGIVFLQPNKPETTIDDLKGITQQVKSLFVQ